MVVSGIRVSIVVACRNEAAHICDLLDSIHSQQMDGIPWEAIIADGMSTDGTPDIIAAFCHRDERIRLIDNPGKIVSTGLNAAIRVARGEIIVRMDAHTVYAPDYIRKCLEEMESTKADNVGGPARTAPKSLRGKAVAAAYHARFSTGGAKFHDVEFEGWVDTVPYGCWKKSTLVSLGGFDESLVRNQDDELNLRLRRAGGKIWQSPRIVSWYTPRADLGKLFRQYFQYGFWKVAVIRKHRLPGSWRHLVPVVFVLGNILGLAATSTTAFLRNPLWFTVVVSVWLSAIALYATASLVASINACRSKEWAILWYLPAVFFVYHVSYGLGFSLGLVKFLRKPMLPSSEMGESAFTSISR